MRDIQSRRFDNVPDIICIADMRAGEIRQFCRLQDEVRSLIRAAMSQMNLSASAYHRILKLAQTIADLAGSGEIQSTHLVEALQYCPKFNGLGAEQQGTTQTVIFISCLQWDVLVEWIEENFTKRVEIWLFL